MEILTINSMQLNKKRRIKMVSNICGPPDFCIKACFVPENNFLALLAFAPLNS